MKPARKPRAAPKVVPVDGPAVITDDHVQDRLLTSRAGSQVGWTRLAVYEKEFRLGHLSCRTKSKTPVGRAEEEKMAFQRRDACLAFDEGWQICNASWPSVFDPGRIKVAGCPGSFVDHQRDAKDYWRRVEASMGPKDWAICRRICGEGCTVVQAMADVAPGYIHERLARFREAVDALIIGMEAGRRGGNNAERAHPFQMAS